MLNFHVLSIFPELLRQFASHGLLSRALEQGLISLSTTQLREFAINTHGQIDDSPYGGGSGMILRPEAAVAALEKARAQSPKSKVILFSPKGKTLSQAEAQRFVDQATESGETLILLCPRYEGVDQRVIDDYVDTEVSIGDYVLMGGESAAMVFIETLARLVPGVLGNPESALAESFRQPRLEYPQYTKPQEFRGQRVPEELLSGNHQKIEAWRAEQARQETILKRPELLDAVGAAIAPISIALIHYPVHNKRGEIVTSSITNIDLHDIARSARTFGVERYYVVHPVKTLRRLCDRISEHWSSGYGLTYNPNRSEALATISIVPDFDDVLLDIEKRHGRLPRIISTSAKPGEKMQSYETIRAVLRSSTEPHLILFGTGWGMADQILDRADYRLEPINGPTDYNHLSVRAAAAIIFDRLLRVKT